MATCAAIPRSHTRRVAVIENAERIVRSIAPYCQYEIGVRHRVTEWLAHVPYCRFAVRMVCRLPRKRGNSAQCTQVPSRRHRIAVSDRT